MKSIHNYKKLIAIILFLVGLPIIILIIGKINLSIRFSKEVKQLFSLSTDVSTKTFQYEQLAGLPEPVQRYFKLVLKEGQPYINYARIMHDGQFKTDLEKDWINIKGEQYATTGNPGFIWKGKTSMFIARDMYIADTGRLIVSLFSLYNIVDAKGEQYNQGELLRWLGESVLYPTNLLPNENLYWFAINSESASLTFHYNGLSLLIIITFNAVGEIIQMETKRYMDKSKLATWIIKCAHYKEMNQVLIPTNFEVLWRLEKGDFSYAKFNINRVEYNNPKQF